MKSDELKNWLHKDIERLDKLLLILATQTEPIGIASITQLAVDSGFRDLAKWNISSILGSSKGKAIRTSGWELTDIGKLHLRQLGVSKLSPAAMQVAVDLRKHLKNITNSATRDFVEEAIKCYEFEFYRSAIVMSWLGAIDVLQKYVHANKLPQFNAESRRLNAKWKDATTPDEIGEMKEFDFLERVAAIAVIGRNVKQELQAALKLRNGCGHPNTLAVGANKAAAHIETLLQNVFEKFN